ncbi:MAG: hypothetical protein KGL39_21520 [Patescibacteria group bacterium]|nr:hypothetical protein [Patescibacteria group bacterium]
MKPTFSIDAYAPGKIVHAASARVVGQKTSPPPLYTEASLLDAMTNAHTFTQDERERAILRDTKGIGTARTRAEIISELIATNMIDRQQQGRHKVLRDTPAGRTIADNAPLELRSVATTAKWEMLLDKIQRGELQYEQFSAVMRQMVVKIVDDAKRKRGGTA